MKLVDILARELKVWPDNAFAITQDEGGALNGSTAEDPPFLKNTAWGSGAFYLDCPINAADLFVLAAADDWAEAIVTCAQWQAAVDALKADEYHEPDNGAEAWLNGVERDYGKDAAEECRAILRDAKAKRDRSKACDEMFGIMSSPPVREGNRSDMAEALYDAGYRKFEIVEN